jgi:hypothetical protein
MSQAADPTTINQGNHGTCAAAAIEGQTYSRNPSDAARIVADVTLTGRTTTRDGSQIQVTPEMLDQSEHRNSGSASRSHASEVFQVTAMNIYHQRHDGSRYEQRAPERQQNGQRPPDSGERLVNSQGEVVSRNPGLTDDAAVDIMEQINGPQEGPAILASDNRSSALGTTSPRVESIESEQDMHDTLSRMGQAQPRQLPAMVAVYSRNEPFFSDSGGGSAGGSGSAHMVRVVDYDPVTRRATIDNSWGPEADHTAANRQMPVSDLYAATLPTGDQELIRGIDRRENQEMTDTGQLELLRQRHHADPPQISQDEYEERLAGMINLSGNEGNQDPELWRRYAHALREVPEDRREAVLRRVRNDQAREELRRQARAES